MDATNETDWEFCPGKQDNYPCVLSIFQQKQKKGSKFNVN